MILGFFSNLFGKKKDAATEQALMELEAQGIIKGAAHIEGVQKVQIIDENTPDDFGTWNPTDFAEYHRRAQEISDAEAQGAAALKVVLKKYGCTDYAEFERIQITFLKHYATNPQFMQAQLNLSIDQQKQSLQSALSPELLAPIDGVSLEVYARIMAKRTQLKNPDESHKMLAEHGLDEAKFNAVDQGWQARMRQAENSDASYALMAEYGKYYAAAGQGQFGAAAQAGAASLGVGAPAGQAPSGGEPCTFERFCEIMAAQNVWAQRGQDVNAMLKEVFDITAADYSNLSSYWSPKMMTDFTLVEKMTTYQTKYEAKYKAGAAGPDDDLSM